MLCHLSIELFFLSGSPVLTWSYALGFQLLGRSLGAKVSSLFSLKPKIHEHYDSCFNFYYIYERSELQWYFLDFSYLAKCRTFDFSILSFSTHFCPIKSDLPGNTVWPQASGFQKLVKRTILGDSKCKRNSLRSLCRMRLFWRFSNTVCYLLILLVKFFDNKERSRERDF